MKRHEHRAGRKMVWLLALVLGLTLAGCAEGGERPSASGGASASPAPAQSAASGDAVGRLEGSALYSLEGGLTLPGQSIRDHLRGCGRAAVFCATLSAPVDTLLRRAQAEDLARALVLDCCASQAIEEVCDRVEEEIKAGFPGCSFPYRFSPGYGDLPITLQGQLLALLDAPRRIGLCASGSHILIPRKSVTAILGISREPLLPAEQRTCSQCFLRGRCQYQLRGKTCGS